MEQVGAGLRDDIDLRPGPFPILGRVGVADQIEFPHRINAQQLPADAARRIGLNARPRVLDSVQQKHVLERPPASHGERVSFSGGWRVRGFHRSIVDRACVQGDQVIETAAIQRQILHLPLIDQPGDRSRGGIDQRRFSGDGDRFGYLAHFEAEVHHRFLPHRQIDSPADRRPEASRFGPDLVLPDGQRQHPITAALIGPHRPRRSRLHVGGCDSGSRDRSSRGVLDSAGNRGCHLRPRRPRAGNR